MFQVSHHCVQINQPSLARILMTQQAYWLATIERLCLQQAPDVVCSSRKWDETEETVKLTKYSDKPDGWCVMASSHRLLVAWSGRPMLCLDLYCPPVVATIWHNPNLSQSTFYLEQTKY